METQECIYCGREVPLVDVPGEAENTAWAQVAHDHATDCEWVLTRAHRLSSIEIVIKQRKGGK